MFFCQIQKRKKTFVYFITRKPNNNAEFLKKKKKKGKANFDFCISHKSSITTRTIALIHEEMCQN